MKTDIDQVTHPIDACPRTPINPATRKAFATCLGGPGVGRCQHEKQFENFPAGRKRSCGVSLNREYENTPRPTLLELRRVDTLGLTAEFPQGKSSAHHNGHIGECVGDVRFVGSILQAASRYGFEHAHGKIRRRSRSRATQSDNFSGSTKINSSGLT